MAEGNQVPSFFPRLDCGDSGDSQNISFRRSACENCFQCFILHKDYASGDSYAMAFWLFTHVNHMGFAITVEVSQSGEIIG